MDIFRKTIFDINQQCILACICWHKLTMNFLLICERIYSYLYNVWRYQQPFAACNFIKKRLQHSCFPVSIVKSLRTAFYRTPLVTASLSISLVEVSKFQQLFSHYRSEIIMKTREIVIVLTTISSSLVYENICISLVYTLIKQVTETN